MAAGLEHSMGLIDAIFGRKKRIATWADVETFIDANAAFIVNRSMYEYSRARAGILADKLFREQAFKDAIEEGRWKAFPIGVGNIAELVEGALRPAMRGREADLLEIVIDSSARVLSKYPLPSGFPDSFWEDARATVGSRLRLAALARPKAWQDIATASFGPFFELVPIHPDLMKLDYEVVLNHVRGTMVNIAEKFAKLADKDALAAALPRAAA